MSAAEVGDLTAEMCEDLQATYLQKVHEGASASNDASNKNSVSQLIRQNLVDQQMNAVAQDAEQKLSIALLDSTKMIASSLNCASRTAQSLDQDQILDSILEQIKVTQVDAHQLPTDNNGYTINGKEEYERENDAVDINDGHVDALQNSNADNTVDTSNPNTKPTAGDTSSSEINSPPWAGRMASGNEADAAKPEKILFRRTMQRVHINSAKPDAALTPSSPTGTNTSLVIEDLIVGEQGSIASAFCPEDMSDLPMYFNGGVNLVGLGDILGNALAVLYVSRQGLREKELWKILARLQYEKESSIRNNFISKEIRAQNNETIRSLASQVLNKRAVLEDVYKSNDNASSGSVSMTCFMQGLRRVFPDTKKSDVEKLLDFMDIIMGMNTTPAVAENKRGTARGIKSTPPSRGVSAPDSTSGEVDTLRKGDKIQYLKFLAFLTKLNRQYRFVDNKPLKFSANTTNQLRIQEQRKQKKKLNNNTSTMAEVDDYSNFNICLTPTAKKQLAALHLDLNNADGDESEQSYSNSGGKSPESGEPSVEEEVEDEEDNYVLGPVIEEALLLILSALGVLHSAENKFLVLPMDSDSLRQVIYETYILERGGATVQYWHSLLIQHFQTEPNSLRRCEELPWHLKICHKWSVLRDTLVELKTFDMMYNNDLKQELMEYWLLLTEGPLYVNDRNNDSSEEEDPGSNSFILRGIDHAIAYNITYSEVRRLMYKNQVQPFDIVEELNKSLEVWVGSMPKPPVSAINKTIIQIARFLAEFSKTAKPYPYFHRIGVNMQALELFGIMTEDHFLADEEAGVSTAFETEEGATGGDQASGVVSVSGRDQNAKGAPGSYNKEPEVKFPTDQMVKRNLYPYLRWVWMQFPWMALHPASKWTGQGCNFVSIRDAAAPPCGERTEGACEDGSEGSPRQVVLRSSTAPPGMAAGSGKAGASNLRGAAEESKKVLSQSLTASDNARLLRVWNIKKNDPAVPVFTRSQSRRQALLRPNTMASASIEKSVDVAVDTLYEQMTEYSHVTKVKMGIKSKDKYRRTFEEELDLMGNIPYAYHCKKSQRVGSLFPTYEKQVRDNAVKKITDNFESTDSIRFKKEKVKKFDLDEALNANMPGSSTFMLTELDDEIRRSCNEEYLKTQANFIKGNGLICDERDLEVETNIDRIARLKNIGNRLEIIKKEKKGLIKDYKSEIALRTESDAQLVSEASNSETLIKALSARNITMEESLAEATRINDGYAELLKVLKGNPPYVESHVQSLEIEYSLAEKQFKELVAFRTKLYEEAEKIDTVSVGRVHMRIRYYEGARYDIAKRLDEVKAFIKTNKKEQKFAFNNYIPALAPFMHQNNTLFSAGGNVVFPDLPTAGDDDELDMDLQLPQSAGAQGLSDEIDAMREQHHKNKSNSKFSGMFLKGVTRRNGFALTNLDSMTRTATACPEDEDDASVNSIDSKSKELDEIERMLHDHQMQNILAAEKKGSTENSSRSLPTDTITMVERVVRYLLTKTESASVDEMIHRYIENQKLTQTLTDQQTLLDTKLLQLNTEQQELAKQWQSLDFLADEEPAEATAESKEEDAMVHKQNSLASGTISFGEGDDNQVKGVVVTTSDLALATAEASTASNEHGTSGQNDRNVEEEDMEKLAEEKLAAAATAAASEQMLGKKGKKGKTGDDAGSKEGGRAKDPEKDDDRYLDNRLFASEARLKQMQLLYDNGVHLVNEVRTSISNIMAVLDVNQNLLRNLPQTQTPIMDSEKDIAVCLAWCEDRILALNEVLAMNGPVDRNQIDDKKTLNERQNEMASVIMQQIKRDPSKSPKKHSTKNKKQHGLLSKTVMQMSLGADDPTARAVMVTPMQKIDRIYDDRTAKLTAERDKKAESSELQKSFVEAISHNNDLNRFLTDALDKHTTKSLTRKANILINKFEGGNGGYGLVLQELVQEPQKAGAPNTSAQTNTARLSATSPKKSTARKSPKTRSKNSPLRASA